MHPTPFAELRTSFASSRLPELLADGILVSISVDTPAVSGNSDLFAHMHALLDLQFTLAADPLSVSARQILELATINGAHDLGLADRVGSLTPGKRADLILVRTADVNMAPRTEPVRMVVQAAQPHNVDTVIVDGRILKRGAQLTALDVEQVVREAAETMDRVRAQVGPSGGLSKPAVRPSDGGAERLRAGSGRHAMARPPPARGSSSRRRRGS